MKSYLQQLQKKIDQISQSSNSTIIQFEYQPGLLPEQFTEIENKLSVKFPNDVKSLFASFNSLVVDWQITADEETFNGYINLPNIFDSIGAKVDGKNVSFDDLFFEELLWTENFSGEEIAERKTFKLLESLDGVDGNFCYRLSADQITKVFFIDKHAVSDTGGNLHEYISFIIDTVGFQNLRSCFIDNTKLNNCLMSKPETKILSSLLKIHL